MLTSWQAQSVRMPQHRADWRVPLRFLSLWSSQAHHGGCASHLPAQHNHQQSNLDGNRFSVLCMVARTHTSRHCCGSPAQGLYSRESCPSLGISMIDTSGSILTMPSSPSTPIRCPWSPRQAATARACDATHATRRLHSCAAQRSEGRAGEREGRQEVNKKRRKEARRKR